MPTDCQSATSSPSPASARQEHLRWLIPLLVVLATLVCFLPVLHDGFVDWDDPRMLTDNPDYRGLGRSQLHWMFTTFLMGHYQPLTWLTYGLDYALWGMDPFGYHLTSLAIHAANGVLFFQVSLCLLSLAAPSASAGVDARVAAGLSALLFAIHPLRVESVAWVKERREVVAGFFLLSTLLCYLRAATARGAARARWLGASVALYAASLLSDASGMTLPLVLLVLDVFPLRRMRGRPREWLPSAPRLLGWEKTPFVLLALAAAVVALRAQGQVGALRTLGEYDVSFRLSQVFIGLTFYLQKTLVPLSLSPLYEIPADLHLTWRLLVPSVAAVVALTVVVVRARTAWPAGLACWVCYVLLLAPVLGIAQSGPQLVADRYSYLSCLSWGLLAAGGLLHCWRLGSSGAMGRTSVATVTAVATLVPLALGVLTWRQAQVWHDTETLWTHVLSVTPRSSLAHNGLGYLMLRRGDLAEATPHLEEATRLNPALAEGHYNLGNAFALQGRLDEALRQYREAVRIRPTYAEAHFDLGVVLTRVGQLDEAIDHYREAVRLQPDDAEAENALGEILFRQGHLDEALRHYRNAVRIRPDYVEAGRNLQSALAAQRRTGGAP
ncbi:MAG TPA: tetratricopeptide repeat protein [Candidatus Nitrosopolaris sp.]|nr:tetratricopeptide repeat protein [Candidatus Nitrosopolaris sp.]